MKPSFEEYTADAICRAVNLPGFIEPAWPEREHPTLRIVLMPSFHPEVCITISCGDKGASVSVIVLAERFWAVGPAAGQVTGREEIPMSTETFVGWLKLFETASALVETKGISLDGMTLEWCLVSRHHDQRVKAHVNELRDRSFVAGILDMAWINCKDPRVRNGLSDAASYIGLKFPRQEVAPDPLASRIAVLGSPEARKEYFEILERAKKARSKK
jgi:hypothetical protein